MFLNVHPVVLFSGKEIVKGDFHADKIYDLSDAGHARFYSFR